jgi:hypothetical protein
MSSPSPVESSRELAGEWLAWARENAKALDPLTGRLALPDNPEPIYSALQPHMERVRGRRGVWPG